MSRLFLLPSAAQRDPAVDAWLRERSGELGAMALRWFTVLRACGADVRELLHDGHPTACVGQAAFAYVNVFTAHLNVGFFHGAHLRDQSRLLQGTGKFMRHVKLGPRIDVHTAALELLIHDAYQDIKARWNAVRDRADTPNRIAPHA